MDPHSFSKLDPDPHSLNKLDPDPHKVNAGPEHCPEYFLCSLLRVRPALHPVFWIRIWLRLRPLFFILVTSFCLLKKKVPSHFLTVLYNRYLYVNI
jgi:hypothetical protein